MKNIFLVLVFQLLSACTPQNYIDISSDNRFRTLIGSKIIVVEKAEALGVTFGSLREKKVDYVYILSIPNFSGAEVVFRNKITLNQRLEVVGVYESQSEIFTNNYFYRVKILDNDEYPNNIVLIKIDIENLSIAAGIDTKIFTLKNN